MLEIWSLLYLTFLCDVKGCSKIQNVYGTRQGSRITCAWAPLEIVLQIKIRLNRYKTIRKSNWNSSRQKHCSTKRIFVVCTQSEIVDFRVRRSPNALLNYVIISSKSSRITKLIRHGFLLQWEFDLDLDFFSPLDLLAKSFQVWWPLDLDIGNVVDNTTGERRASLRPQLRLCSEALGKNR